MVLPSDVIFEIVRGNPVDAGRAFGELLRSEAAGHNRSHTVFATARGIVVSTVAELRPVLTKLGFNADDNDRFSAAVLKAFEAGPSTVDVNGNSRCGRCS